SPSNSMSSSFAIGFSLRLPYSLKRETGRPVRPTRRCSGRHARCRSDRLKLAGRHLAAALVALQLEAHRLAFIERGHAGALDGRDVHEHVVAAVARLDE